jgi:primosomal protein N' (replication factor Y)
MHFIEVIIPLALAKTFTYQVSEAEFAYIQEGCRVAVPFGKSKIYTALVIKKHHQAPELYEPKEIFQLLDEKPIVTQHQLNFWVWMAEYYMCGIGEVYHAAIPSALLLESETVIKFKNLPNDVQADLTDEQYLIMEALQKQSVLTLLEVAKIIDKKNVFPLIQQLIKKDYVSLDEEIYEAYKPKMLRYVKLSDSYTKAGSLSELLEITKNAPKQKQLILGYYQLITHQNVPVSTKKLISHTQVAPTVLKTLIDKNVFEPYFLSQDRISFDQSDKIDEVKNEWIEKISNQIELQFSQKDIVVLKDVTKQNQLEVYFNLIEKYLNLKKQILFLVPEIVVVSSVLKEFTSRFGNQLIVYHSRYNNNEKVEIWNKVLNHNQTGQIIVGTRSSVFLPFNNLGLVIVDQEHDVAYKQNESAPRYHTRDSVIMLAHLSGAKTLLSSSTPSFESIYNIKSEKYGVVEGDSQDLFSTQTEVVLCDLKDKYKRKRMTGHFSDTLIEEMSDALANQKQVVLYQNRRGYAPILECISCGHVPQCSQCNVSLTYHQHKNQLRCHYCGYTMAKPSHCHACSSVDLSLKGFGTEQVEKEVRELFPEAKVARLDQDTTRGKHAFELILEAFKEQETDILIGTQMVTKGVDFSNVGLSAVLNVDNLLYHPDFRSFEKTYQILSHLIEQTHQEKQSNKVIIQTYNPQHEVLQKVKIHDYEKFTQEQLIERQTFIYPPFCRLIKITLKHKDYDKLKQASEWFYSVLVQKLPLPVLGPEEPSINRIRNQYIRLIQIKIPQKISLPKTKSIIQKTINSFDAVSAYRNVQITVNVDNV